MIPDHLIEKAKAACINKCGKTCSHDSLTAALEAVAADIWDEGHAACDRDWAFTGDLSTPDEDRKPWTNPYREAT